MSMNANDDIVTKGTKGSLNQEQFWYRDYGLNTNPFAIRDASVHAGPFVATRSYQELQSLLAAGESVLVKAPWGAGKTATAHALAKVPNAILVPGLSGIRRVAGKIMRQRHPERRGVQDTVDFVENALGEGYLEELSDIIEARITRIRRPVIESGRLVRDRVYLYKEREGYYQVKDRDLKCPECGEQLRALQDPEEGNFASFDAWRSVAEHLFLSIASPEPCPVIRDACLYTDFTGWRIFIDSPNEVTPAFLRELGELCLRMESNGGQVCFFGTPEQIAMAKRYSDKFRKWRTYELREPESEFWIKLIQERVKPADSSKIFTEAGVQLLASMAHHNPREFLKLCSEALILAKEEDRKDPIDEQFISSHLTSAAPPSHEEAVKEVLSTLREKGTTVIKNKDLVAQLESTGLTISSARLGRIMLAKGYERRYNPDAEYFLV